MGQCQVSTFEKTLFATDNFTQRSQPKASFPEASTHSSFLLAALFRCIQNANTFTEVLSSDWQKWFECGHSAKLPPFKVTQVVLKVSARSWTFLLVLLPRLCCQRNPTTFKGVVVFNCVIGHGPPRKSGEINHEQILLFCSHWRQDALGFHWRFSRQSLYVCSLVIWSAHGETQLERIWYGSILCGHWPQLERLAMANPFEQRCQEEASVLKGWTCSAFFETLRFRMKPKYF